jgi:hypothetical protein
MPRAIAVARCSGDNADDRGNDILGTIALQVKQGTV